MSSVIAETQVGIRGVRPEIRLSGNRQAGDPVVSVGAMSTMLKESPPALTLRQKQVVELIAVGCSNEEVGERLGISPRTAKAHCDVLARNSASRGGDRFRTRSEN